MASLVQFSRRIRRLALNIEKNSGDRVRRTALAVDQALVLATPVDEGTARSNWRVGLDNPLTEVVPAYAPGKGLGLGEGANAARALQQAQSAIFQFTIGRHSEIHITNNLPYIQVLNDGHSAQAPAGFVEEAIAVGSKVAKSIRVTRKR